VACAHSPKLAYTPDELRAAIQARVPSIESSAILVPHLVDAAALERARSRTRWSDGPHEKLRALANQLTDEAGFGLEYDANANGLPTETLRRGRGNCLSLASVLIGLARSLELPVFYIAGKDVISSESENANLAVAAAHLGVGMRTKGQTTAVDFGGVLERYRSFRAIDDLEAAAHFYNNRGYDLLRTASDSPEQWQRAFEQFEIASEVSPGFAFAWNNMGIAAVHLDRFGDALSYYQRSIDLNSKLSSPHFNSGALYVRMGDAVRAVEAFEAASKLAPNNELVLLNYARALLELGRFDEASVALHRVLEQDPENEAARKLLTERELTEP
jgi:tetratricopeptide (TPR) repeat protein